MAREKRLANLFTGKRGGGKAAPDTSDSSDGKDSMNPQPATITGRNVPTGSMIEMGSGAVYRQEIDTLGLAMLNGAIVNRASGVEVSILLETDGYLNVQIASKTGGMFKAITSDGKEYNVQSGDVLQLAIPKRIIIERRRPEIRPEILILDIPRMTDARTAITLTTSISRDASEEMPMTYAVSSFAIPDPSKFGLPPYWGMERLPPVPAKPKPKEKTEEEVISDLTTIGKRKIITNE